MSRARDTADNGHFEPSGLTNVATGSPVSTDGLLAFDGANWVAVTKVKVEDGTDALPGYSFTNNPGLGMSGTGSGQLAFSVGGALKMAILSDGSMKVYQSNYDTLVTQDSDIPNKKYVDDAILAGPAGLGSPPPLYNIVEDLTPQLGGDLDVNGKDIVGLSASTSLNDTSGNELISFVPTAVATCGIVIANNSSQTPSQGPTISVESGVAATGLKIEQKGAGYLSIGNNAAGAYVIIRDEITFRKSMQFLQVASATNAYSNYMKIYSDNANPPQLWSRDDTGVITRLSAPPIAEITDVALGSPLVANELLSYDGTDWTNESNLVINGVASFNAEFDNGNSGASDTIDWNESNKQKSTISASTTLTFTDPPGPASLTLRCIQNASYTLTLPAAIKWPSGTAPTLTTGAASIDIFSFYFDGTTYYGLASQDFS